MPLTSWSDFHAWRVAPETMLSAGLALGPQAYAALIMASEEDDRGYVVPREAIEDAALAMPLNAAIEFLAAVYALDNYMAEKLLQAIHKVRT